MSRPGDANRHLDREGANRTQIRGLFDILDFAIVGIADVSLCESIFYV